MKRLCIILFFLSFSAGLSAEGRKTELTVYYFNRAPYYIVKREPEGFLMNIAKLVFEEAGLRVKFSVMPAKRILFELKKNEDSCSIGWFRSEEREKLYTFSEEIYQDGPYCLVAKKSVLKNFPEKPLVADILSSGFSMGIVDGYIYGDWLDRKIKSFEPKVEKVRSGGSSEQLLSMLLLDRFDYLILTSEESRWYVKGDLSYVRISDSPDGNKRFIIFSKGCDPEIVERVNKAVRRVVKSRRYKEIVDMAR